MQQRLGSTIHSVIHWFIIDYTGSVMGVVLLAFIYQTVVQSEHKNSIQSIMKTIRRQALLPFSAMQMFELVDDIENYPQFLPNCQGAQIIKREQNQVVARLSVAKGSFSKDFTTRNINFPGQSIEMQLVDGPFKHLTGRWDFQALDQQACKIELVVQFEFANILSNMMFSGIFNQMAESFVEAFSQRAREVYAV